MFRTRPTVLLALSVLLLVPASARADITAFLGVNPTPTTRGVRGFSAGVGLLVVAFEFEYAHTNEDLVEGAPELRTFMGNALIQTPVPLAGMQFYGTVGGGGYRETLNEVSDTNIGWNIGGGVKISLLGPVRLRLDYRAFTLKGNPRYANPQRFYAGLNLKF